MIVNAGSLSDDLLEHFHIMITPNIIRQYINNISDIATALKCIFPAVWDYSTSINKPTNSPTGRFMSIILNRLENYHFQHFLQIHKITFPPGGSFINIIPCYDGALVPKHLFPSQIAAQEYADKICESIKFETFFDMKLAIKPLNMTLNAIINAPALPDIASIIAPIPIDHPLPNTLEIEWNPSRSLMAPSQPTDNRETATTYRSMLKEMINAEYTDPNHFEGDDDEEELYIKKDTRKDILKRYLTYTQNKHILGINRTNTPTSHPLSHLHETILQIQSPHELRYTTTSLQSL
eukprot:821028_1